MNLETLHYRTSCLSSLQLFYHSHKLREFVLRSEFKQKNLVFMVKADFYTCKSLQFPELESLTDWWVIQSPWKSVRDSQLRNSMPLVMDTHAITYPIKSLLFGQSQNCLHHFKSGEIYIQCMDFKKNRHLPLLKLNLHRHLYILFSQCIDEGIDTEGEDYIEENKDSA